MTRPCFDTQHCVDHDNIILSLYLQLLGNCYVYLLPRNYDAVSVSDQQCQLKQKPITVWFRPSFSVHSMVQSLIFTKHFILVRITGAHRGSVSHEVGIHPGCYTLPSQVTMRTRSHNYTGNSQLQAVDSPVCLPACFFLKAGMKPDNPEQPMWTQVEYVNLRTKDNLSSGSSYRDPGAVRWQHFLLQHPCCLYLLQSRLT